MFFRLDKRDVCCRPTAYSRHPATRVRTASASGVSTASACRSGQGCIRFRFTLQFVVERFDKLGGRLWRRRRCLWAWYLSAYRRDSAFVGLNAQWLVSQPVLCHQASAAIVASLTNSTCQAAAALAFTSPTSRNRAGMIARENGLTMLAARCLSDRYVIKLTCG